MRKTIKVKLKVRDGGVPSEVRYQVVSLTGALTVPDNKVNANPGDWISQSSAQRLVDSPRYDVTVVPETD